MRSAKTDQITIKEIPNCVALPYKQNKSWEKLFQERKLEQDFENGIMDRTINHCFHIILFRYIHATIESLPVLFSWCWAQHDVTFAFEAVNGQGIAAKKRSIVLENIMFSIDDHYMIQISGKRREQIVVICQNMGIKNFKF